MRMSSGTPNEDQSLRAGCSGRRATRLLYVLFLISSLTVLTVSCSPDLGARSLGSTVKGVLRSYSDQLDGASTFDGFDPAGGSRLVSIDPASPPSRVTAGFYSVQYTDDHVRVHIVVADSQSPGTLNDPPEWAAYGCAVLVGGVGSGSVAISDETCPRWVSTWLHSTVSNKYKDWRQHNLEQLADGNVGGT